MLLAWVTEVGLWLEEADSVGCGLVWSSRNVDDNLSAGDVAKTGSC